jgi:hypothetical protein
LNPLMFHLFLDELINIRGAISFGFSPFNQEAIKKVTKSFAKPASLRKRVFFGVYICMQSQGDVDEHWPCGRDDCAEPSGHFLSYEAPSEWWNRPGSYHLLHACIVPSHHDGDLQPWSKGICMHLFLGIKSSKPAAGRSSTAAVDFWHFNAASVWFQRGFHLWG